MTTIVRRLGALAVALLAGAAPALAASPPELRPIAEAINLGDLDEAGQRTAALLADALASGDDVLHGWALLADGDIRFYRGDYAGSLARAREAEALLVRTGDDYAVASARKNAAIALKLLGRVEEGVALLESVLPTMREVGSRRDVASVIENTAVGYLALGDGTRAHAYLSEALQLAEASGDDFSRFHALTRLAVLYLHTGFPERVLAPARAARAAGERLDLRLDLGWPESIEATALARLGRLDDAIALQQRAVDRGESIGNAIYLVDPYRRMGELLVGRDPREALDWYDRARTAARRADRPASWLLELDTGAALRRAGDLTGAIEHLRKAVDGLERERGAIVDDRYRSAFGGSHRRAYGELVEALLERASTSGGVDDIRRAFRTIEQATARGLLETIQAARLGGELHDDPTIAGHLDELDREIARLQSELVGHATTRERRRAILDELDRREDDWARLVAEARDRDPRWAALRFPEPVDVETAGALIPGDAAMVVWFEVPGGLAAFVLAAGSVDAVRLDIDAEALAARIRVLLDAMGRSDDAWRPIARRLHADLIEPLDTLVPPGVARLVLVPDGALHFLPFEALVDGDGRFLLERFVVSYAPSASALAGLRERATARPASPGPDLLLMANPVVAGESGVGAASRSLFESEGVDLSPLPYSAREARRVARFGQRPEVLLGPAAVESRLDRDSLASFRVLHFATHGAVSAIRPWRTALVLTAPPDGSEDGFLQVREIYDLRLAADLVVLAACRSGRGRILRGEGVEGLARAFLHAGSRSVLASLIDVADDRTETLVTGFYGHLARGIPVADALRAAKLDVARSADMPPAAWAGFVVIGDGETTVPLRPASAVVPGWLVGGGLLALLTLLAAGAALAHRRSRSRSTRVFTSPGTSAR